MGIRRVVFVLLAAATLLPWVPTGAALIAGIVVALTLGNPFQKSIASKLLQVAVVGLGFGMNLKVVLDVGAHGIGYTFLGIFVCLVVGTGLRKLLRVSRDAGLLVSVGTAICGGSAIAAVSSSIGAKKEDTTAALAVVFLLNAAGLLIFPPLGHALALDESQFGVWAALAIHDTSSVVGAAAQYGPRALEIATTIKLARALWIVPVSLAAGWWTSRGAEKDGARPPVIFPLFIVGFVVTAAVATFLPAYWPDAAPASALIARAAKQLFVLALFLIGAGLSKDALKALGPRPLVLGVALWLISAGTSLAGIEAGLITEQLPHG